MVYICFGIASYPIFIQAQRSLRLQHLQLIRANRAEIRWLRQQFGYDARRAITLLRRVVTARLALARLYRETSFYCLLFGNPYLHQRRCERALQASYTRYRIAFNELLDDALEGDNEED